MGLRCRVLRSREAEQSLAAGEGVDGEAGVEDAVADGAGVAGSLGGRALEPAKAFAAVDLAGNAGIGRGAGVAHAATGHAAVELEVVAAEEELCRPENATQRPRLVTLLSATPRVTCSKCCHRITSPMEGERPVSGFAVSPALSLSALSQGRQEC